MQRMLTGLVLVLFLGVLVLAVAVYKLSQNTGPAPARQPPPPRTAALPEHDPAAATRDTEQERLIRQLQDELAAVKRELRARAEAPVASPGAAASGGGGAGEGVKVFEPGVRPRDLNGDFVITEEDMAFFSKVQERVLLKQRIDSTTSVFMRRIDSLVSRGEIQPLADDRRRDVEQILRKYVASGETLFARYRRTPDEDANGLTPEQRRDELTQQRTQLVASAQAELEPLLGAADAKKIADESLERQWGLGRPGRRLDGQR